MRISLISIKPAITSFPASKNFDTHRKYEVHAQNMENLNQVSFRSKHESAKLFGIVCGVLGTAGAIGGSLIMTGGLAAIPYIIGYGALSAGIGAVGGHILDKGNNENYKKNL